MATELKNIEFVPKGKTIKRPLPLAEPEIRFVPTKAFTFKAEPIQKLQEQVAKEYGILDEKDLVLNYVWHLGYASKGARKGNENMVKERFAHAFLCGVMLTNSLGLNLAKCVEQDVLKYLCDYGNTYHGKEYACRLDSGTKIVTAPVKRAVKSRE